MATKFNPDELILERVRAVEAYDLETSALISRNTQIESPSLTLSAEGTNVVDALGSTIATFYNAQTGTFTYTNSLHSLDLLSSQFATEKVIGSEENKILVPISEVIEIKAAEDDGNPTATLKYVPAGAEGAEIKYVKVIGANNEFGDQLVVDPSSATAGKFTINAAEKKIALPTGTTGKIFVHYETEIADAVKVSKKDGTTPGVVRLEAEAIFRDKCNTNLMYAGKIVITRAQIDPSSIEVALTSDGKHSVTYNLQKEYCAEDSTLVDIIVYK